MEPTNMIRPLLNHFTPEVAAQTATDPANISVEFVEMMPTVEGIRFDMVLTPPNSMTFDQLEGYVTTLEQYCVNDSLQTFELDGYHFIIGDGDDSSAVRLEDGKFKIWLRGWKQNPFA